MVEDIGEVDLRARNATLLHGLLEDGAGWGRWEERASMDALLYARSFTYEYVLGGERITLGPVVALS